MWLIVLCKLLKIMTYTDDTLGRCAEDNMCNLGYPEIEDQTKKAKMWRERTGIGKRSGGRGGGSMWTKPVSSFHPLVIIVSITCQQGRYLGNQRLEYECYAQDIRGAWWNIRKRLLWYWATTFYWSKRKLVSQTMHKNWSWISIYLLMILKRHFSYPILSLLNLMSKPFNLKYWILYFLLTQSCSRSGTGQMTCGLFAKENQKLLNISFGTALIRIHSGNVLNHIILGCENN